MNNKKKKELSKFQKTLAIIGLILCAAGAIFGFSLWLPGFIIFLMVLIGLLATVLYDRAILPTSNEVPYAILSGVIVFVIGMVYLVKQKNQ